MNDCQAQLGVLMVLLPTERRYCEGSRRECLDQEKNRRNAERRRSRNIMKASPPFDNRGNFGYTSWL